MKASQTIASKMRPNERGQALAELIIATSILAIILFGIVTTIIYSINAVALSANKTLSVYYAQEGLEMMRGMRNQDPVSFSMMSSSSEPKIGDTIFSRTINIVTPNGSADPERIVTSTVTWSDGTQAYETKLVTVLMVW